MPHAGRSSWPWLRGARLSQACSHDQREIAPHESAKNARAAGSAALSPPLVSGPSTSVTRQVTGRQSVGLSVARAGRGFERAAPAETVRVRRMHRHGRPRCRVARIMSPERTAYARATPSTTVPIRPRSTALVPKPGIFCVQAKAAGQRKAARHPVRPHFEVPASARALRLAREVWSRVAPPASPWRGAPPIGNTRAAPALLAEPTSARSLQGRGTCVPSQRHAAEGLVARRLNRRLGCKGGSCQPEPASNGGAATGRARGASCTPSREDCRCQWRGLRLKPTDGQRCVGSAPIARAGIAA